MNNSEQAQNYLNDRDYKMKILHDEGVFRTLQFTHGDSTASHFLITTWPGHLCISGDMGAFVFSRTQDMITFFSGDGVNPQYWAEKVQAESRFGKGIASFSLDSFIEQMNEEKKQLLLDGASEDDVADSFSMLSFVEDEYSAVNFFRDFSLEGFELDWETSHDEYNFHHLFACYAINYACNLYLNEQPTPKTEAA